MSEELEKNMEGLSAENANGNREGYQQSEQKVNNSNGEGRPRIQRPRIHTSKPYGSQKVYNSSTGRESEGGFRPEGFGASLQSGPHRTSYHESGYQPRQGGYQPRASYQRRSNYQPRYNQDGENGYQSRQSGYQSHQGGYQPRQGYQPRYNQDGEGGYQPRQPRQGGYQPRQGYQPRYNQDGENSYQSRQGGYQSRQGGYQPRQGYQPRYNQDGEGGYQSRQPRQGGYQPRQGGYQKRQGYDPNAKYSLKKRIEYSEEHIDPTQPIRLNKYLANAGVCSRREADDFIQSGLVTVNGEVVTELGTKVMRTDEVVFHDRPVSLEKKVYVLLNKPKDTVTTSDDPQNRKTVMDLVKGACPERIYPVGRLDRNTTGVLLLTNDGELASKLTHPKFMKKKVYHVILDKEVTAHDMQQIRDGITLSDGEIHADAIEYANEQDKTQVGIEIHSGKNRIVRRIFESLGYRVMRLDRVQFAGLTKKNVRRGDWRFLTEKEVSMLRMGAFE